MFLQDDIRKIENELEAFKEEHSYVYDYGVEYSVNRMSFDVRISVKGSDGDSLIPYDAEIFCDRSRILEAIHDLEMKIVSKHGD